MKFKNLSGEVAEVKHPQAGAIYKTRTIGDYRLCVKKGSTYIMIDANGVSQGAWGGNSTFYVFVCSSDEVELVFPK